MWQHSPVPVAVSEVRQRPEAVVFRVLLGDGGGQGGGAVAERAAPHQAEQRPVDGGTGGR